MVPCKADCIAFNLSCGDCHLVWWSAFCLLAVPASMLARRPQPPPIHRSQSAQQPRATTTLRLFSQLVEKKTEASTYLVIFVPCSLLRSLQAMLSTMATYNMGRITKGQLVSFDKQNVYNVHLSHLRTKKVTFVFNPSCHHSPEPRISISRQTSQFVECDVWICTTRGLP